MPYADLYAYSQTLEPKIKRNELKAKVLEITGSPGIAVMRTDLDVAACRGFYLSARNVNHRFVQQNGGCVIVLARVGLNHCWERFVFVKELMHIFDDPAQATDSGEVFEQVLKDIIPNAPSQTPQAHSEYMCFWMALGVLCPEKLRQEFAVERAAGRLDDYAIAVRLRVPQLYVGMLFEPRYKTILNPLVGNVIA
jgi:hypothetical protein